MFCIDSVNIDSIEFIRDPSPVSTVLTSSTYIVLQPLGVFDLSSTSSIYFNIHSI